VWNAGSSSTRTRSIGGPEWRAYNAGERADRSRVGAPTTQARHDKGLSIKIGWGDRDATEQGLSGRKRRQLGRLRREHRRGQFRSKLERNRAAAFGEITRIGARLELGRDRREQACQLFREAHEADLLRGRGIDRVAAACLFAVCRIHREPVVRADVVDVACVGRGPIDEAYRALDRELGIPAPPPRARTFVPTACDELGVGVDVRRRAEALADRLQDCERCPAGCRPTGVAAGAVYHALCEARGEFAPPQGEVAAAAGSTSYTLRRRVGELRALVEGEDAE
jgi:transcription initiation factor TFIIB